MDYVYKYGVSPKNNSWDGNKFGVDNIVVCLDYNNLKNIFHHFYGSKACFEGYINKFSDKVFFHYSLQEQIIQFYVNELSRVSGMDGKAIMVIVDQFDFASYTLRQLYHAKDGVEKQITLPNCNLNIIPHKGLYIVAAILRRLGQSDDEITTTLSLAFKKQPIMIGTYAATSMILRREYDNPYINFSFGEKDDGYLVYYQVNVVNPDGMALIERRLNGVWNNNEKYVKPEEEIQYILKYVNN